MEILLFVMMLATMICVIIVLGKLNQIEFLLRNLQNNRFQQKPSEPPRIQNPAGTPAAAQKPATPPAPAMTAAQRPAQPPVQPVFRPQVPPKPQTPPKPKTPGAWDAFWTWFCVGSNSRENVSTEYAAATTWLIRAGIIVLLCGIGFFLKYSIEKNLLRPELRICMTFLAGLGMLIGGMYGVRKRFHILAVGILSAGIITFYMGSYAGCKFYSVLPTEFCFVLMVLTTIASMVISARLDLLPAALTGCAGAYLTPVLLSDHSGNLPFLCCYTVIVSAGILIVSRIHRWRSLETMAFFLSFLLLSIGAGTAPGRIDPLCIASVFVNFLVFSLIPVIRKKDSALGLMEWLLPILSAAWGLALGICMIQEYDQFGDFEDLASAGYAVLISAVTLCEGILLTRKRTDGEKLLPAFLCAAVFSLAMAIPLALQNASASAAGWSILGAVLALAAERSGRKTLLVLTMLVFTAAFFAVLTPAEHGLPAAFADRFFRGGFFTIALFAAAYFLRKKTEEPSCSFRKVLLGAGGISFLIYTSIEIFHNLKIHECTYHFRHGGLSVWWAVLAVLLIAEGIRKNIKVLRISGLTLFVVCIVKVYGIDISGLNTLGKVAAFLVLGLLFLGGAAAYIQFRKRFLKEEK